MLKVALFLALVGTALSQDIFDSSTRKYGWTKISQDCFGKDRYDAYLKATYQIIADCTTEVYENNKNGKAPDVQINEAPMEALMSSIQSADFARAQLQRHYQYKPPAYVQSTHAVNPFRQYQSRQKRQVVVYTSQIMKALVDKLKDKVGVFLCVLRKRNSIDENNNLVNADLKANLAQFTPGLDPFLSNSMNNIIDKCVEFSKCANEPESPLPIEMQRILAYFMCDKKSRLQLCMKWDLRNNLDQFELTGLPQFQVQEDAKVEKLLSLLHNAEPGTDALNYLT